MWHIQDMNIRNLQQYLLGHLYFLTLPLYYNHRDLLPLVNYKKTKVTAKPLCPFLTTALGNHTAAVLLRPSMCVLPEQFLRVHGRTQPVLCQQNFLSFKVSSCFQLLSLVNKPTSIFHNQAIGVICCHFFSCKNLIPWEPVKIQGQERESSNWRSQISSIKHLFSPYILVFDSIFTICVPSLI